MNATTDIEYLCSCHSFNMKCCAMDYFYHNINYNTVKFSNLYSLIQSYACGVGVTQKLNVGKGDSEGDVLHPAATLPLVLARVLPTLLNLFGEGSKHERESCIVAMLPYVRKVLHVYPREFSANRARYATLPFARRNEESCVRLCVLLFPCQNWYGGPVITGRKEKTQKEGAEAETTAMQRGTTERK